MRESSWPLASKRAVTAWRMLSHSTTNCGGCFPRQIDAPAFEDVVPPEFADDGLPHRLGQVEGSDHDAGFEQLSGRIVARTGAHAMDREDRFVAMVRSSLPPRSTGVPRLPSVPDRAGTLIGGSC